jgi:signal transduction histidine kinase
LRDFAAALSHEFKTPLAGLRGGIELLQDHGASMSGDERARFLANIAADTDRLSRLVGRMLDLAQADMRGGEPAGSADLEAVLARLADGLRAPDFAIDYAVAPEVPPLAIEPAALESILATLIDSAQQAGAGRIAISASATGSECTIDLADDGPGVPAGDRERIFDPFFTSRRDSGGTGLGLPIARALVGNRGGSLELVEGGDGGHFVIVLPVSGGLPQTM